MDQKINVFIWNMDETLILLKSLITGSYAKSFNGSKDVQKGIEIGKTWENQILRICDDYFFYEQAHMQKLSTAQKMFKRLGSAIYVDCGKQVYLDERVERSEDDVSRGETEVLKSNWTNEDRALKDKLLRKYSKYISSLKHEFSNKKKKGKLPKEARQVLLDWWNIHYRWAYPTEADKTALAESTGLDQKQINNWFINQRKRHWKPSENMQFAVIDGQSLCNNWFILS